MYVSVCERVYLSLCMSVYVRVFTRVCVRVSEKSEMTFRSWIPPSPCGIQWSHSGHLDSWDALLPSELSSQALSIMASK